MADEQQTGGNPPVPPTGAHSVIHEGTTVQIKMSHVVIAVGVLLTGAFTVVQYFYGETHEDIEEIKKKVDDLEDEIERVEDKVDANTHKIGEVLRQKEAATRLAKVFHVTQEEAEDLIGVPKVKTIKGRRTKKKKGGGSGGPFVSAGTGENPVAGSGDDDNDGVPFAFDKCPNDRETWNGYQDEDGCPDELPATIALEYSFQQSVLDRCQNDAEWATVLGKACQVCKGPDPDKCRAAVNAVILEQKYPVSVQNAYDVQLGVGMSSLPSRGETRKYKRKKKRTKKRTKKKFKKKCSEKWDDKKCWKKPVEKDLKTFGSRLSFFQKKELFQRHRSKMSSSQRKSFKKEVRKRRRLARRSRRFSLD